MQCLKYSIVIAWSDDDQAFVALSPEFDGLSAFGDTPAKAANEAQIAMQLFVDALKEEGQDIPTPKKANDYKKDMELIYNKLDELEKQASMLLMRIQLLSD